MEMTDRELLELAAKAAGFEGTVTEYRNGYCEMGLTNHFKQNGSNVWMPLTDDGDALRLAVKLGMDILQLQRSQSAYVKQSQVYFGTDPYAATRRAIVMAAGSTSVTQPSS